MLSIGQLLPESACRLQRPQPATFDELTRFHSDEYVSFLKNIRPDNISDYGKEMQK